MVKALFPLNTLPLDWAQLCPRLWERLLKASFESLSKAELECVFGSFPLFAERYLKVKDRASGTMIAMRLNAAQKCFFRAKTGHDVILKSRQLGMSSLIIAYYLYDAVVGRNVTSVIVAHDQKATERLMQIVHLFWDAVPQEPWKPQAKYSSKYELYWPDRNSRIFIVPAGSPDAIRGASITNLHCSEVAFWPDPERLIPALFAAGPPKRIILETTANGMGGWFYDFWHKTKRGSVPFTPHFFDWTLEPTYAVKLGRGENITPEPGLTAEQTKFAMHQRSIHGERFCQEYPRNDVECFIGKSRSVFDLLSLTEYLKVAAAPKWRGNFGRDGRFYGAKEAAVFIWAAPKRTTNYVIGVDVAEGLEKGDFSCAYVLDIASNDLVASWHGKIDPDLFADELAAMGYYYGGMSGAALLAVEANNHGLTTLNALRHMKYARIFYQRTIDKRSNKTTDNLGWRTDMHSKPMAIDILASNIRDGRIGMPDKELIEECLSFIRLSATNGAIMGADAGCYDDRVMAAAIALAAAQSQPVVRPPSYVQQVNDPWRRAEKRRTQTKQLIGHDEEGGLE